jgi:hypothetical protein
LTHAGTDSCAAALAAQLCGMTGLRELKLDGLQLSDKSIAVVAGHLSHLATLTALDIDVGNACKYLAPTAAKALTKALPALTRLEALAVRAGMRNVRNKRGVALDTLGQLTRLTALHLRTFDAGRHAFAAFGGALRGLGRLQRLTIDTEVLAARGIEGLGDRLSHLTSLTSLDLRGLDFTRGAMAAVAPGLQTLRRLRALCLFDGDLEGGVGALAAAVPALVSLTWLKLCHRASYGDVDGRARLEAAVLKLPCRCSLRYAKY